MTALEQRLEMAPLQPQLTVDVRVTFENREYLDAVCKAILGTLISGYTLSEHMTTYVWEGRQETKTNYLASTLVPLNNAPAVVHHFHREISKQWKTPHIQVVPCFVLQDFYNYFTLSQHP